MYRVIIDSMIGYLICIELSFAIQFVTGRYVVWPQLHMYDNVPDKMCKIIFNPLKHWPKLYVLFDPVGSLSSIY